MQDQYGDQLQIIGIDTSHPAGDELYGNAIEHFEIPQNRLGVPTLIVGDVVLVGSGEIPARFPELVKDGLLAGGIGWPDIPDLAVIIPDLPSSAAPDGEPEMVALTTVEPESIPQDPQPAPIPTAVSPGDDLSQDTTENTAVATGSLPRTVPSVQSLENVNTEPISSEGEIPPADPVGFALAMLALFGMPMALLYTSRLIIRPVLVPAAVPSVAYNLSWAVPALALIGLAVASYLAYVEVAQVEAVCGPVGECNIVQSSPYAQLIGIPVGVLGALFYFMIVVLWIGQRFLPDRLSALSLLSMVALTILGTGFSIYLTVIELFVIRAVCAWCLSSAVLTALLMILVAKRVNGESLQVILSPQT